MSKVCDRRGTVQIYVDAVVTEPCPRIKSLKQTESGPEIPLEEFASIASLWMLNSELSVWPFFPSPCNFDLIWQRHAIILFTALQVSFSQYSSVAEHPFFHRGKYEMTMGSDRWYFQIKFVWVKKKQKLKSKVVAFFTFTFTGSFLSLWSVRWQAPPHSSHCDDRFLDQSRYGRVWTNEGGGEVAALSDCADEWGTGGTPVWGS